MAVKEATQPGKSSQRGLMIALGVVILALLGVIAYLLLGREAPAEETGERRNVIVNEENLLEVADELRQPVKQGYFKVGMNTDWSFPDGTSASTNAYVENSKDNQYDVYFDLMLTETEEVILASPVIPLGGYMTDITLDKDLDPGDYECDLVYHLLDGDQKTVDTLVMGVMIHVLA